MVHEKEKLYCSLNILHGAERFSTLSSHSHSLIKRKLRISTLFQTYLLPMSVVSPPCPRFPSEEIQFLKWIRIGTHIKRETQTCHVQKTTPPLLSTFSEGPFSAQRSETETGRVSRNLFFLNQALRRTTWHPVSLLSGTAKGPHNSILIF